MVTFIVLLVLPPVVMMTVSSARLSILSNQNADDSSEALLKEELDHLERISSDEAQKINELFDQIVAEVTILDTYSEQLINEDIIITPYQSYWWNDTLEFLQTGRTIPGIHYDPDYDSNISYNASCYYMPRDKITSSLGGDPFAWTPELEYLLNVSSNMDIAFRNLHEANPNYVWIYASFADPDYSLFRNYPYDSMNWTQYNEEGTIHLPPADDWDPLVEDWYLNAAAINNESNSCAFTAPYFDPAGLLISVGRPIYFRNGTFIGVVSVDITVATMQESILNLDVSKNGYAFLVDDAGDTITHPKLEEDFVPILDLEMSGYSSSERTVFQAIITSMQNGESGLIPFTKGGEDWYIAFNPISASGYSLALVLPKLDITEPINLLRADIIKSSTRNIIIMVAILLLLIVIIVYLSVMVSRRIVQPVQQLTDFSEQIAGGDLSQDLNELQGVPREVQVLHNAFAGLLTALRFGNTEYYSGNMDVAYNNYLKALELFRTTDNQRGVGVCLNNLGNIYRAWGETEEAVDCYIKAINVAETLSDKGALASRYNNYGLILLESNRFTEAQQYLEKALNLNEEVENQRGKIQCLNNLGLLHFKLGSVKLAKQYYEDALKAAKEDDFLRGAAHSELNLGVFYLEQFNVKKSITFFKKALENARVINDVILQEQILQRLNLIEKELGTDASQDEIKEALQSLRGASSPQKAVLYVLDYSGSMSGSRSRASVRGSIDLFETEIKDRDTLGIVIFNIESRTILEPLAVKGNKTRIKQMLQRLTRPTGNTALWDAVAEAILKLNPIQATQKWLVLLTDGEDNASRRDARDIQRLIDRLNYKLHLVIISVGDIGDDENRLRTLCNTVAGTFIKIDDTRAVHKEIEKAFKKVGELMSQAQVSVEGLILDDL